MSPSTPAPAFAALRPLTPLIDKCVHCGFCLPACPSYLLLGQEMDSPRGRIYLMQGLLDGTVELNETVTEHFDNTGELLLPLRVRDKPTASGPEMVASQDTHGGGPSEHRSRLTVDRW